MKKLSIIIAFLFSAVLFPQENEDLYILEADSTWLKEVIRFPLSFAKDINYEGYEDLRFAKNWSKPDGSEFFTYAFVWNINLTEVPTTDMLETNIKLYYDGLMKAVNKDKDFTVPKTKAEFKQINQNSELPNFKGDIQVYDAFFTKEEILLNVTVETTFCKTQNKFIMLFRVSTLDTKDKVWLKLNEIKLSDNYCDK